MGQGLSCTGSSKSGGLIADAVQNGDLELVKAFVDAEPNSVLEHTFGSDRLSALHLAAAYGQIEVLSMLLNLPVNPDVLTRHKQTPLMFAALHGKVACVEKLISAGANILKFESLQERTCLHYAVYNGHSDCLQVILSYANSLPVATSWGFARFVNVKDGSGSTPLHLAALLQQADCMRVLLDNGALVCASTTGGNGYYGSTPLHMAARGGSLECVRLLLAWGADRVQRDASGRIPFMVAMKYKNGQCAALLNPSSVAPLVWPAPLQFISELDPEVNALLEQTFVEANLEREKSIFNEFDSPSSLESGTERDDHASEVSGNKLCCICFDQACAIEVQECGHQMCARCILALFSHNKPNSTIMPNTAKAAPVCPFCRSTITKLIVAKSNPYRYQETTVVSPSTAEASQKLWHSSEGGNNSFRALSSFVKRSGKVAAECGKRKGI